MTHPIEITPNMNCVELFDICANESPELLEKTLLGLVDGTIIPTKQCEDGVCFADKLTKEECLIDWSKSAQEIHNLVRGVYKCPSAYFEFQGKIIKVLETEPLEENFSGNLGEFVKISKLGIDVKTGKGTLRLIKVKPEGKGEMLARDWGNGLHL
jgi:methionyl-tRNA formyltransferase